MRHDNQGLLGVIFLQLNSTLEMVGIEKLDIGPELKVDVKNKKDERRTETGILFFAPKN